jgi:hypothetical protein
MRADNSHPLLAAARRRTLDTRDRAIRTLRRMDAAGRPITMNTVASGDHPDIERLASAPILRLTPFIEQMGNPSGRRKEFWWERAWRHVGDLSFGTDDIVVVFAPEDEHDDLQERLSRRPRFASRMPAIASNMPAFVDAQWGLERMIGALADVADLGPFPE